MLKVPHAFFKNIISMLIPSLLLAFLFVSDTESRVPSPPHHKLQKVITTA